MKKCPINRSNAVIFILALIIIIMTAGGIFLNSVRKKVAQGKNAYKFEEGMEDEFFSFDESKAKKIDDSEPCKEGETWAVYMYLNASNLELCGHSQLSNYVQFTVNQVVNERLQSEKKEQLTQMNEFIATEKSNSVPMPLSFYAADYSTSDLNVIPEDKTEMSNYAWGSDLLKVFKELEFPENYTYVVQPGGAPAWKDTQVNPNRTRRYVKQGNELKEVYDAPVENMGESQTLTDFLKFCKENYPADHTIVILTDHGGAYRGFGWDYIYGDDGLSLKELTKAFDDAYGINEKNPPVDLLYFNACLMSNTDVINAMRGVTKYMVAGEELGLSFTEYYGNWAKKLCENPKMNAVQIGKALIDSYARELSEKCGPMGEPLTTGLGMLDMAKAPLVYDAYSVFAKNVLANLADNPGILTDFSRAVTSSISFAENYYKSYNVTDLGLWVEGLKSLYPKEAETMVSLIDDAVIYKRVDSYLKDAHGISVYFPNYVEDMGSLITFLGYAENISNSKDISALYYYKVAGCLNNKYKQYFKDNNIKEPQPLNYAAFNKLRNLPVEAADEIGNIKGTIPEDAIPVIMDIQYELCKVDENANTLTYYGKDRYTSHHISEGISTGFEGKWLSIGGSRLAVNVINATSTAIVYESPVKYKGFDYKLIIIRHRDPDTNEETTTIEGLRSPDDEAATIDRNVIRLTPGSYITPVYEKSEINGEKHSQVTGRKILYSVNTKIDDTKLEKGKYRARVVIEDIRGDDVYTEPVFFEVK